MGFVVKMQGQLLGILHRFLSVNGDVWTQCHLGHSPHPIRNFQSTRVVIAIMGYHHTGIGAKMKIPKHVARRQRIHEKIFWIDSLSIPPESRIRRTRNGMFPRAIDVKISPVLVVSAGTCAQIARPNQTTFKSMYCHKIQCLKISFFC